MQATLIPGASASTAPVLSTFPWHCGENLYHSGNVLSDRAVLYKVRSVPLESIEMEFEVSSVSALKLAAEYRLDAHLLHKESADDVLLSYGHGAIPARIRATALDALDPADAAVIATHYKKRADLPRADEDYYYNTSVPPLITHQEANTLLADEDGLRLLSDYYSRTPEGFVICAEYVAEMDEILLLRKLGRTAQWIHDADRCRISDILESAGILENNPRILYAVFYNDLNNYFFYRKHHEHVPGMMTIEAARQSMYAHAYRYSGIKRGDVSISMKTLAIDFQSYTNANYPVRIVMQDGPNTKPQKWLHKRARFFQMGRLLANFEFTGPPIQMDNFRRKRVVPVDPAHRFEPVKNILRTLCLTADDGRAYECELNSLAAHAIQVTFKAGATVQPGEVLHFTLYAKHFGYLHAHARIGQRHTVPKGIAAELIFLQPLSDADTLKLSEIIKNFTHVVPTDQIL
jgi:hypothetical protein